MNELKIFENPEFGKVRIKVIDNKLYFDGTDVVRALGYSNTRDALSKHCKGVEKRYLGLLITNQHGVTMEHIVEMLFIPEADVYRLIMRSELPDAERFQVIEEMNELTTKKEMLWTGFEDANGTRIYENDLFFTEDGATLRVVLDGGCYCLEPYDGIADCQSMDWAMNHVIAGSLRDEN